MFGFIPSAPTNVALTSKEDKLTDRELKLRDMQLERHIRDIPHPADKCFYCNNKSELIAAFLRRVKEMDEMFSAEERKAAERIANEKRESEIASYETLCKSYFNDPTMLDEYREGMCSPGPSTIKERFARAFCRLIGGSGDAIEPDTEHAQGGKSVPPQPNELAALYKMIMSADIKDDNLVIHFNNGPDSGNVTDIYNTWLKIARDRDNRFHFRTFPIGASLEYRNGEIYTWRCGADIYIINHDGTKNLVVLPPSE